MASIVQQLDGIHNFLRQVSLHSSPENLARVCEAQKNMFIQQLGSLRPALSATLAAVLLERLHTCDQWPQACTEAITERIVSAQGSSVGKTQRVQHPEDFLTDALWDALYAASNFTERASIMAQYFVHIGLRCPDERTLAKLTAILVCVGNAQHQTPQQKWVMLKDVKEHFLRLRRRVPNTHGMREFLSTEGLNVGARRIPSEQIDEVASAIPMRKSNLDVITTLPARTCRGSRSNDHMLGFLQSLADMAAHGHRQEPRIDILPRRSPSLRSIGSFSDSGVAPSIEDQPEVQDNTAEQKHAAPPITVLQPARANHDEKGAAEVLLEKTKEGESDDSMDEYLRRTEVALKKRPAAATKKKAARKIATGDFDPSRNGGFDYKGGCVYSDAKRRRYRVYFAKGDYTKTTDRMWGPDLGSQHAAWGDALKLIDDATKK